MTKINVDKNIYHKLSVITG